MTLLPVWPSPLKASSGKDLVWINQEVPIFLTCGKIPNETNHCEHADCTHAKWTQELLDEFQPSVFLQPLVPERLRPFNHEFEPDAQAHRTSVKDVVLEIIDPAEGPTVEANEEYTLELLSGRDWAHVRCSIRSYSGGYYAFQTLRQLFYKHSEVTEATLYTPYAPLEIKDKPLFTHRGLNLDIARNRIRPEDVIRTIDGMAATKLNRLHLHATDSQSWPMEIPSLPRLAQMGSYHPSQVWTSPELAKVQAHGQRRGVEVFVEIGMPGHAASIHHSYPELIVAYDQRPWEPWAAEPPSGQLKLNSPQVCEFIKTLLRDLLPRVAQFSKHFHIGADEINAKVYELDPGVKSSSRDVIRPGLQALIDVALAEISQAGLMPVAFEELLLDWNLNLPKSTIIQVWRSHESITKVVERGHRVIFGPASHWYLDAGYGGWVDPDSNKKDSPIKPPFLDWNNPYKNWRQVCSYNPFEGVPQELHHLLHGGETNLWAELTDSVTLDGKVWPRAAAAAETLWAGPGEIDERTTRRLAELRERLVLQGLGAAMVQMEWSLRNVGGSLL